MDGKGNTNPLCDADREHASKSHRKPDRELTSMHHLKPRKLWVSGNTWHLARFVSVSSGMRASTASTIIRPSFIKHYGVVYHTQRSSTLASLLQSIAMERSVQVHSTHGLPAALHITTNNSPVKTHPMHGLYACNMNVPGSSVCLNSLKTYSSSVKVEEHTNEGKEETNRNDASVVKRISSEVEEQTDKGKEETKQEDVFMQMLEMMGFHLDGDISAVANELRQAQQEMLVQMRRCSRALFAVGAVHLTWGSIMFCALESPLDHAVLTEVCMSSLVICGLAYQLKQTMKPIKFFINREEHHKMKIIFVSRQVTRMLGTFFHRGYGIAFVLSLTLTAHSLSCIRFLL